MSQPSSDTTRKGNAPYRRIRVIINPAAGQDRPILGAMNKAFHEANIDWEVSLTKEAGDGLRFAQEAVAAGVDAVGVYGGDGTVMEVANGLIGSGVPLAIFPGGTANVMSVELGIPNDLTEAMALVRGDTSFVRVVDLGRIRDRYFLLRIGIGFEADMITNAERDAKNNMGKLSYILSALRTIPKRQIAHYRITIDGAQVEADGVTCMIANSGNIGLPGIKMSKTIDVSDGLLDVLVIRDADVGSLLEAAANALGMVDTLQHWQGKQIEVSADPPQHVIADGEPIEPTPIVAEVIPQALKVIVPRASVPNATAREIDRQAGEPPSNAP